MRAHLVLTRLLPARSLVGAAVGVALVAAPAAGAERVFIRIASSGSTTGFYFVATGFARVIEKHVANARAAPEVTGGCRRRRPTSCSRSSSCRPW